MDFVGTVICYGISFCVQATFVLLAAKVVRLSCSFKEAAIIAAICAVLLFVPKVGFILPCACFFVLFFRWLAASAVEAIYAFLAFCMLNVLLVWAAHSSFAFVCEAAVSLSAACLHLSSRSS